MEYMVVIHRAEEGGFWAEVPALSGCYTQGETLEEVVENVQDAIATFIDGLKQDGEPVPSQEGMFITTVTVAA